MYYFIILLHGFLASTLLLRSLKPFSFLIYITCDLCVCVLFFLFFSCTLVYSLFPSLLSFFKSLKVFKIVSVFSVLKFYDDGFLCGFRFIQGAEYWCPLSLWKHLLILGLFLEWGCWLFLSNFFFLSQTPFIWITDLLDQSSNFPIFSFLFAISFLLLSSFPHILFRI